MPLPTTVEEFVEAFLDAKAYTNQIYREFFNSAIGLRFTAESNSWEISKEKLKDHVTLFHGSFKGSPEELSSLYNPIDPRSNNLDEAFINEFQKQLGMNVIRRHPLKTLAAGLGVGFGAFALPLAVLFTMSAVTGVSAMGAVFSFLPFLAALGPVGAVFAFSGLIAAAALVIYGLTVGITAAATTPKKIEIKDDEKDVAQFIGNRADALAQRSTVRLDTAAKFQALHEEQHHQDQQMIDSVNQMLALLNGEGTKRLQDLIHEYIPDVGIHRQAMERVAADNPFLVSQPPRFNENLSAVEMAAAIDRLMSEMEPPTASAAASGTDMNF
jgi:hypothetical protein